MWYDVSLEDGDRSKAMSKVVKPQIRAIGAGADGVPKSFWRFDAGYSCVRASSGQAFQDFHIDGRQVDNSVVAGVICFVCFQYNFVALQVAPFCIGKFLRFEHR